MRRLDLLPRFLPTRGPLLGLLLAGGLLLSACNQDDVQVAASTTTEPAAPAASLPRTTTTQQNTKSITDCLVMDPFDQQDPGQAADNHTTVNAGLGLRYLRSATQNGISGVTEYVNPLISTCQPADSARLTVFSTFATMSEDTSLTYMSGSFGIANGTAKQVTGTGSIPDQSAILADPSLVPSRLDLLSSYQGTPIIPRLSSSPPDRHDNTVPSAVQRRFVAPLGDTEAPLAEETFYPGQTVGEMALTQAAMGMAIVSIDAA